MRGAALAVCLLLGALFPLGATGTVLINEVEVSPSETSSEWVELYNLGNLTADISGWTVTITDGAWVGRMSIPPGTVIMPKGFYVIEGRPQWHHGDGGYATLYDASGEKVDDTPYLVDKLHSDIFTYSRHPDGHDTNTNGDWGFADATKGRSN